MRRIRTLVALLLAAACDQPAPTIPKSLAKPGGISADLLSGFGLSGQTSITSTGTYTYQACDDAFGDDLSGQSGLDPI